MWGLSHAFGMFCGMCAARVCRCGGGTLARRAETIEFGELLCELMMGRVSFV